MQNSNKIPVLIVGATGFLVGVPNPVVNKTINLAFHEQPAGMYSYNLVNSSGQVIFKGKIVHSLNNITERIQLKDNILPGQYILEMTDPVMKKQSVVTIIAGP